MSAAFTIYRGAKVELDIGEPSHGNSVGWVELTVTETDGRECEITIHFVTKEGFAVMKQLVHLQKAINATKEPA